MKELEEKKYFNRYVQCKDVPVSKCNRCGSCAGCMYYRNYDSNCHKFKFEYCTAYLKEEVNNRTMLELYNEELYVRNLYRGEIYNITKYVSKLIEVKEPLFIVQLRSEFRGENRFGYLLYFNKEGNLKRYKFKVPIESEKYRRIIYYHNKSSKEGYESDSQFYNRCFNQASYYVSKVFSENFEGYISRVVTTEAMNNLLNISDPKTFKRFKYIYNKIAEEYKILDNIVSNITRPIIGREVGNSNKNSFDWIKVQVELIYSGRTKDEQKKYILKCKNLITSRVLSKLETSKEFTTFDIPIEYIEVSNIVYRHDNVLEYTFDIKKEIRDLLKEEEEIC